MKKTAIDNVINGLTEQEAKALLLKLCKEMPTASLEDVGTQFEITVQRIKEIEKRAMGKINKNRKELRCSFCKKYSDDVARLIAAPENTAYICNECIIECNKLI